MRKLVLLVVLFFALLAAIFFTMQPKPVDQNISRAAFNKNIA